MNFWRRRQAQNLLIGVGKMKILPRMLLLFVSIVLIFGIIMTVTAHLNSQREQKNTDFLYVERGISIAKTIDASVHTNAQLHGEAQRLVDELKASGLDVVEINIVGTTGDTDLTPSGYWTIASSNKSLIHRAARPEDLDSIQMDKYNVLSTFENGKSIINVNYPLHNMGGKPIATVGITFDMSGLQSQMSTSSVLLISLVMTLLAILASFIVAKSITIPITKLRDVADKVSMGDLQQNIMANSDDEINELGQSFQRMINAFKISQAMNQEAGNL
jgi:HAMP domain-containing protein